MEKRKRRRRTRVIFKQYNKNVEYLTPLAICFTDDGSKCGLSVKIAINCFTEKEILFLCKILKNKYNILSSKIKEGKNKEYSIYMRVLYFVRFSNNYKLNGY